MKERRKPSEVLEPEYLIPPVFDADGVQASSGIGRDGKEYPDPVPMAPPVGFVPAEDLMSMIKRMVRNEQLMAIADKEGFDTFEEAEDFDIEDDPLDPLTPYERVFEVDPVSKNGVSVGHGNSGPSVPDTSGRGNPQSVESGGLSSDRQLSGSPNIQGGIGTSVAPVVARDAPSPTAGGLPSNSEHRSNRTVSS